jgi:hypothetical protein
MTQNELGKYLLGKYGPDGMSKNQIRHEFHLGKGETSIKIPDTGIDRVRKGKRVLYCPVGVSRWWTDLTRIPASEGV